MPNALLKVAFLQAVNNAAGRDGVLCLSAVENNWNRFFSKQPLPQGTVCLAGFLLPPKQPMCHFNSISLKAPFLLGHTNVFQKGWLYGMGMDSYKSQILDGVLMVLVQTKNHTSSCLKLYGPCIKFFGTNECTHSRVPGLKGETLFFELLHFFVVSADRRLVQIRVY
jgi:hypothetical protein